MSAHRKQRVWNRREVLAAGCALAGTLGLGRMSRPGDRRLQRIEEAVQPLQDGAPELLAPRPDQDGKPDLAKALAATKELGLHYWESYPAHVPMDADRTLARPSSEELAKRPA